ncbi:MAG: PAS domain-containing protein [Desulfobacter sp.]|nr:MAG: PAS domain-containing protein [Desulfobacter sp.]
MGKAVANRRKGSLIFILGFLFIPLTVVNDILYTRQVIFTIHLVPLGLFVFIFSQALLLSNRFSHAFSMVEKQSVKLSVTNTAYEAELDSRTRAEAELNASKEQYQKLIQDSPDGVCIIKNEKIEYVNLRFVEMAGATRQEVEGSSFIDFIHPLDREKTVLLQKIFPGQRDRSGVKFTQHKKTDFRRILSALKFLPS